MTTDAVDERDAAHEGFVAPAACGNPGPFVVTPTLSSLASQMTGTWINCEGSIFGGAGVPLGEVGVVVRADQTWQKIAVVGGQVTSLTRHTDYGTWTTYGGGIAPSFLFTWDTTGLATTPTFSTDGRTLKVTTAAGGNMAILAKATGTP